MHESLKFVLYTLFFSYRNIVFPAQAYAYFSADIKLKILLYYSYVIAYDIFVLEWLVSIIVSAGFFPFVGE